MSVYLSTNSCHSRLLFLSLGDLRLAMNDIDGAVGAYEKSLNSVLLKGGMVEKQSFWSYFQDSVGDFLAEVVPREGSDIAISPNYAATRRSLLLGIEKGTESYLGDLEIGAFNSTDFMLPLGHKCFVGVEALNRIENSNGFCTHYALSSSEELGTTTCAVE